jgi:hypothetical protein
MAVVDLDRIGLDPDLALAEPSSAASETVKSQPTLSPIWSTGSRVKVPR